MKKIRVIGNTNLDIIYEIDRVPADHEKLPAKNTFLRGGGAGANTAYWLAALGHPTVLCGLMASDDFGNFSSGDLRSIGVDTSECLRPVGYRGGVASIFSSGEFKCMVTGKLDSANKYSDHLVLHLKNISWDDVSHVHLSYNSPELIRAAREMCEMYGLTSSIELKGFFDAGVLRQFDIAFSNYDEITKAFRGSAVFEELAKYNRTAGPIFFITAGHDGAFVIQNGEIIHVQTKHIKPVDRTGGGDAFDAGVLYRWVRSHPLIDCTRYGLALAREVILRWGARPEIADITQILTDAEDTFGGSK